MFEAILAGIVVVFIAYSAWRDWLFVKTLREQEELRQKPIEKMAEKALAKDLSDLKFKGEPNDVTAEDANQLDLTEDLNLRIPKEFNIELEGQEGVTKARIH